MGSRVVRTCDYCKEEVGHAWIEVTADGDDRATYQDVADIGIAPDAEDLIFDKPACVARYFAPNIPEEKP